MLKDFVSNQTQTLHTFTLPFHAFLSRHRNASCMGGKLLLAKDACKNAWRNSFFFAYKRSSSLHFYDVVTKLETEIWIRLDSVETRAAEHFKFLPTLLPNSTVEQLARAHAHTYTHTCTRALISHCSFTVALRDVWKNFQASIITWVARWIGSYRQEI